MVNYREVRIGNLVKYDNRIFEIDSIAKEFPTLNTDEFGIGVVDWKNIEPIVLNPEWLKHFGFEELEEYENSYFYFYKKMYNKNKEDFDLRILDKSFYIERQYKIKHIHQLQNAYFDLTNEWLQASATITP